MYFYCYVCSVLGTVIHFVVLCSVYVLMCTIQLPPGVNQLHLSNVSYIISQSGCGFGAVTLKPFDIVSKVTEIKIRKSPSNAQIY